MPRITREQMKKDEEKVIKLLLTRANESIDSIAKKCGFSRQKAWRIIKRLEKNKTIWGYHAVVDKEKLNMRTFYLFIKAKLKPIEDMKSRLKEMIDEDTANKMGIIVELNSYIHGPFDWIIIFNAKDTMQAKKFSHVISQHNAEYIAEIELSEEMFPIRKCNFINPNVEKIKEFVLYE